MTCQRVIDEFTMAAICIPKLKKNLIAAECSTSSFSARQIFEQMNCLMYIELGYFNFERKFFERVEDKQNTIEFHIPMRDNHVKNGLSEI